MRIIHKGATSQTLYLSVNDSASTTGGKKTGIAFNSSGIVASYTRNGAARTAITLATQTASGAWSSGGWVEVDSTNEPGLYRFDVPDAAFASGVDSVVVQVRGVTGMVDAVEEVQLTAVDLQDAVRAALTALPNAAAGANGGLPLGDASARVDVGRITGTAQTARDLGASVLLSAGTGTGQLDFTSGVVKANLAQILGTALTETAGQLAAGFKQFFNIASPTSTMNTITTVTTATNLTTNNDKTGYSLSTTPPTAATISAAVVDQALSGHTTAGTVGGALNSASSAGDPWGTALPGAYASGTAGNIVGNRVDAAITSRMATFTLPTNFSALAIDVSGRVTVGAIVNGAIAAATFAANALDAVWSTVTRTITGGTITTNSDKTGYSLASAPPTVAAIATQVWSETIPGSYTAGQAGGKLNTAATAGGGGGSGGTVGSGSTAYPITITRADGTTPIEGVAVWVSTDSGGTNVVAGTLATDAFGRINGTVGFMLDRGNYFLWRQHGSWQFANPTSFVVS